ncbi:MAG TPA: hypothetical protein VGJ97_00235 [Anaerolineaceae bacterium]|jgi:hypothetical protein
MGRFDRSIATAIRVLVILGFISLPYTHLRWIPDLGTTRPVSAIFFALAFGLVALQALAANRLNWRAWWAWPKTWDGWPVLRWWVGLLGLGALSAAITPFYGLPREALTRLIGYLGIFSTLFMAAYSLPRYGIRRIARWTLLGYLPALAYALVETAAIFHVAWAASIVLWVRSEIVVDFLWGERISLLATEPSFVAYQLLLIALLLPYAAEKWLRWPSLLLIALCLVFSQSGMVVVLAATYLVLWGLFSLRRRILSRLALVTTGFGCAALLADWLIPGVAALVNRMAVSIFSVERLRLMSISVQIRYHYILNLVYALWDTRGLGLGIGQYGYFWRAIYQKYIDYRTFDPTGEVARALSPAGGYMKPWSVLLGVGVDLGVAGLALLAGFLWQVYRALSGPRQRALFFTCLVALAGAYPIITPHIWLALALMAGIGSAERAGGLAA